MGLSDFFKRRRERESAIPGSVAETGEISTDAGGTPSAAPTPAAEATREPAPEPAPPTRHGSIADEVAAATGGDLATQVQRLEALMAEHSVNLESQPTEVRQAIVDDLNARGVPAKLGEGLSVSDRVQIQTVVDVLKKHGLLPAGVTLAPE